MDGNLYFQRWPRKQPTARTAAEQFNRDALQVSTQIVKLMDSYQINFARELAAKSQLASQDFLYIALFGRIGHMVRRDGKKVFSMAAKQSVSQLLDAIWQNKGGILVRGDTWWDPLAVGNPDQVLTVQADGSLAWETPAAPPVAAGDEFMAAPPMQPIVNSNNFGGNAFAAIPIFPKAAINITGIRLWCTAPGSGHTIYAGIYDRASGSATMAGGALLGQGTAQALTAGLNILPFAAPVAVTPDRFQWLGVAVLGAGNVNFGARDYARTLQFFAQTTGSLPNPAPAITNSSGNNGSWWGY